VEQLKSRLLSYSNTSLERLAGHKHSSLRRTFVDCNRKKFYKTRPCSLLLHDFDIDISSCVYISVFVGKNAVAMLYILGQTPH
jgi:hypothetical protein